MAVTSLNTQGLRANAVTTDKINNSAVTNDKLAGSIATSKLLDATATPGASKIVVSDGAGKLPSGWGGSASGLATLDSGSVLVQAAALVKLAAPGTTAGAIGVHANDLKFGEGANERIVENTSRKGAANGYAALDGSSLLSQAAKLVQTSAPGTGAGAIGVQGGDLKFGEGANERVVENTSRKNAANGYAGLDGGSKVAAANLPSLDGITAPAADLNLNSKKIIGLANGTASTDAVTKGQLDSVAQGLRVKPNVAAATVSALADAYNSTATTLTKSTNGAFPATIDGVATTAQGTKILVKNEAGALEKNNGWYELTTVGSGGAPWVLTRVPEADTADDIREGSFGWVEGGTQANTRWAVMTGPATLGTDPVTFGQIGGALSTEAGAGLVQNGAALDVNTDNATLEVAGDQVRVKDLGVGTGKIADNAVTYGKMQQAGASKLIGNSTGGTANVGEVGVDASLAFSGANLQRAALTGDVTAPAGNNATTIAADVVTAAKATAAVRARLGGAADVVQTNVGGQAPDGTRTRFDLDFADVDGTAKGLMVFLDGILMELGSGNDYTFGQTSGTGGKSEVIMEFAPVTNSKLLFRYRRTSLVG